LHSGEVGIQHNLVGGAGLGRVRAKADDITVVLQLNADAFGGRCCRRGQNIRGLTNIVVVGKGDVQIGIVRTVHH